MRKSKEKIKIHCCFTLYGEPAQWLLELKKRRGGLSNREIIIEALKRLYSEMLDEDIKRLRIQIMKSSIEERRKAKS